ncbi:FBD-associated F-box protein At3g52670, partial [Citrus clementina]|uniref:FBD-associated F-box protein At3g52670 n=1 Tax=Citrus clementina TaxID=85681 RepID=UPI000CED6456
LPDSVLCHILSFLPTNIVVASSILSSRWRLLWTSLYSLWFDERIELGIAEEVHMELPESIYSCSTLEVLKLHSNFDIKVPDGGMCFPCVKIIHVMLKYPDNKLVENLLSNCSLVKDLCVNVYLKSGDSATSVIVDFSTLKRLALTIEVEEEYFSFLPCHHRVVLRALNLQFLHIVDDMLVSYMVEQLHLALDWAYDTLFPELRYLEVQFGEADTERVLGWTESGSVPNCLLHRVKKIELKGLQGEKEGIGLIQYLLMHGTVSEKCTIWSKGPVSKRKLKMLSLNTTEAKKKLQE